MIYAVTPTGFAETRVAHIARAHGTVACGSRLPKGAQLVTELPEGFRVCGGCLAAEERRKKRDSGKYDAQRAAAR